MGEFTDITSLPGDDRLYFPATPPAPGMRTVCWTKGIDVALPPADYVALYELNDDATMARSWGTVPFNALVEEGAAGHIMGVENNRICVRKEGWPTQEWIDRNRVSMGRVQP
jgi:hypothetical protein